MMTPPAQPRVGSAVVVTDSFGRVLLGTRAKDPNRGKWVLPGGKVHPFESLREAGRREMREETGLEVEIDATLTVREIIKPPDEHRLIVFSHGRAIGGSLAASSDLDQVRFFDPGDLARLDLSDVVRDVLVELGWLQQAAA
jgi:8-oxo-dGTP diphosphatase